MKIICNILWFYRKFSMVERIHLLFTSTTNLWLGVLAMRCKSLDNPSTWGKYQKHTTTVPSKDIKLV